MNSLSSVVLVLLIPALARCAIWYQPAFTTSSTEAPESPRVVAADNRNYSISFVPLITLLAGVIPRIISKIRTPTTEGRSLDLPRIPPEFKGANPCIDSILVRRPYPGDSCFFYQCEMFEPSTPLCRLQVLQDPDSPTGVDHKTVERKSSLIRISNCLSIRVYRCSAGHKYDKTEKKCVKHKGRFNGEDGCILN